MKKQRKATIKGPDNGEVDDFVYTKQFTMTPLQQVALRINHFIPPFKNRIDYMTISDPLQKWKGFKK